MRRLYTSLFAAFLLSACVPAQPVSFPARQEVEAAGEREVPRPDKLPEFRYRPGSGLRITAPDKSWGLQL